MGNKPCKNNDNNGGGITNAKILNNIMASRVWGWIWRTVKQLYIGTYFKNCIGNIGHYQHPIPIFTDNLTDQGLGNNYLKIGQWNFMSMRFHWTRYRVKRFIFRFCGFMFLLIRKATFLNTVHLQIIVKWDLYICNWMNLFISHWEGV